MRGGTRNRWHTLFAGDYHGSEEENRGNKRDHHGRKLNASRTLLSARSSCRDGDVFGRRRHAPAGADAEAQGRRLHRVQPPFVNLDCKRWEVTNTNKNGFLTIQCGDKTAFLSAENGNLSKIVSGDGETLDRLKPCL